MNTGLNTTPSTTNLSIIPARTADDIEALRPLYAHILNAQSSQTDDAPFTAAEAYIRRGSIRTPIQVAHARYYDHNVTFYGSRIQSPPRETEATAAAASNNSKQSAIGADRTRGFVIPTDAAASGPELIDHRTTKEAPLLCFSWVSPA